MRSWICTWRDLYLVSATKYKSHFMFLFFQAIDGDLLQEQHLFQAQRDGFFFRLDSRLHIDVETICFICFKAVFYRFVYYLR